jgi:hypothetical protein
MRWVLQEGVDWKVQYDKAETKCASIGFNGMDINAETLGYNNKPTLGRQSLSTSGAGAALFKDQTWYFCCMVQSLEGNPIRSY